MEHKIWDLALCPGVPDLALCPGTGLWPVRNQATQQEVSGGQASNASSVFPATPHCSHYCLSSASCQVSSSVKILTEFKPLLHLNHSQTITYLQSWKNFYKTGS